MTNADAVTLNERYLELLGLRYALAEYRDRLKQLGLVEAAEHLAIADVAIVQALVDLRAGSSPRVRRKRRAARR